MSIYDKILNKIKLNEKDSNDLMVKRGFTEETIEHFELKSPIEPKDSHDLIDSIGVVALQRERLISGSSLIPAFTRNGLIPFFENNSNGERSCVQIKGHKYGLPAKTPKVFRALRKGQGTLYLCESEYKAIAMHQLGYSAVGLCGISTFIGKHFSELISALCSIKPEKCVVVFDNDCKSDPSLPKFTADPSARYDAFKYQWYIALMLEKNGISSFVANLPNIWRVDGQCDIDGCLAMGKTREDFDIHLGEDAWLTPEEFKESWIGAGEIDDILTPWSEAKLKSTQIKIKSNCMWSFDKSGDPIKLSNFDMYISTIHVDDNDSIMSRYVTVINEFGKKFDEMQISNSELANSSNFSKWCLSHRGNLIYSGESRNMSEIGTYLNTVSTPSIVRHTDVIGWNSEHNAFLFKSGAYQEGVRVDAEEGRMFLPSGAIEVDSPFGDGDPPFEVDINPEKFDWRDAIEKMVSNYGDPQVRIVVTWCLASSMAHMFESIMKPKMFPLLWVTGAMGSGKNTLLTQSLSFCGIHGFEGMAINQVTEASLWRMLSHFGSMPLWIDELRDDKRCNEFDGVWRSIYNRTCTSKSKMNSDKGIITNTVRGTLALSGQDISGDTALNQRFIPVKIAKCKRTGDNYDWINENSHLFSNAMHYVLSNIDSISKVINSKFRLHKSKWKRAVGDDRMAANISVISVVAEALDIDLECDFNLRKWARDVSEELVRTSDDMEFLSGIAEAINDDPLLSGRVFAETEYKDVLFLNYSLGYIAWKRFLIHRGQKCMSRKAIEDEMFSHHIAVGKSRSYVKNTEGNMVQARGILLDKKSLPKELLSAIEAATEFSSKITNGRFRA